MKDKSTITMGIIALEIVILLLSCTTESDVLKGNQEAAYLIVTYNDEISGTDGIHSIAATLFRDDGKAFLYFTYPPGLDVNEYTWKVNTISNSIELANEEYKWIYELKDEGLYLIESMGNQVEDSRLQRYIGSSDNAIAYTDSIVIATYPGGVNSILHRQDAQLYYDVMHCTGADPVVRIDEIDGLKVFIARFGGRWLGDNSSIIYHTQLIRLAFSAAGLVTKRTTWESYAACVVFEDYMVSMETINCRSMIERYEYLIALAFYPHYTEMLNVLGIDSDNALGTLNYELSIVFDDEHWRNGIAMRELPLGLAEAGFTRTLNDEQLIELGYYGLYAAFKAGQYWDFEICEELCGLTNLSASDARQILLLDNGNGNSGLNHFIQSAELAQYPTTLQMVLSQMDRFIESNSEYLEI